MKSLHRILAMFLSVLILLTIFPLAAAASSISNFKPVRIYSNNVFSDVGSGMWFAESVKSAYQFDLMAGVSDHTFSPYGNITLAQAVVMAVRLHSIYNNTNDKFDSNGAAWYSGYVSYAKKAGILTRDYADYNKPATRAEFAVLLAHAFPESALQAINEIADGEIPDVSNSQVNAKEIYQLYRAGVLSGSASSLAFRPTASIQRAEAASIVTRMAIPDQRVRMASEKASLQWKGDPELDFEAQLTDGRNFKLSDQAGKVVLLNFWATWCGPCVGEMPSLEKLYSAYSTNEDVEIIAINCAESSNTVKNFISKQNYHFPVVCDPKGEISSAYGIDAIPCTIVFGRDGTILNAYSGALPYNVFEQLLSQALEK